MSPGCFFCAAKGLGQAGKEGHPEKGQGRLVKNLPAMQVTQLPSLGREDSPGEGNENPLQYSYLENCMDRGASWATVVGIIKNRILLCD